MNILMNWLGIASRRSFIGEMRRVEFWALMVLGYFLVYLLGKKQVGIDQVLSVWSMIALSTVGIIMVAIIKPWSHVKKGHKAYKKTARSGPKLNHALSTLFFALASVVLLSVVFFPALLWAAHRSSIGLFDYIEQAGIVIGMVTFSSIQLLTSVGVVVTVFVIVHYLMAHVGSNRYINEAAAAAPGPYVSDAHFVTTQPIVGWVVRWFQKRRQLKQFRSTHEAPRQKKSRTGTPTAGPQRGFDDMFGNLGRINDPDTVPSEVVEAVH